MISYFNSTDEENNQLIINFQIFIILFYFLKTIELTNNFWKCNRNFDPNQSIYQFLKKWWSHKFLKIIQSFTLENGNWFFLYWYPSVTSFEATLQTFGSTSWKFITLQKFGIASMSYAWLFKKINYIKKFLNSKKKLIEQIFKEN